MEEDKIKMHINIAGQKIAITVPFSQQDDVREAEKSVSTLYAEWRKRFPSRPDTELLAMISYQYASFYLALLRRREEAQASVERLNTLLDEMLKG